MNTLCLTTALLFGVCNLGAGTQTNLVADFSWNRSLDDARYQARVKTPFAAAAGQSLAFKVKSPKAGRARLYWSSTSKKPFGSPARADFRIHRADSWEKITIHPYWHGAGDILAFMIMPPSGVADGFAVKDIELVTNAMRRPIDADATAGVLFEATSDKIAYGTVVWHQVGVPGKKMLPFTTAADGATHTYWFDLKGEDVARQTTAGKGSWKGQVDYLGVERITQLETFPAANLRCVTEKPILPADLGITSFNGDEAIPRAGRPLPLEIILRNYGTVAAEGIRFSFPDLPAGLRVLNARELCPTGVVAGSEGRDSCGVGHDYERYRLPNERLFRVTLSEPAPGEVPITLEVNWKGGTARRKTTRFTILPSLNLPKADYVPRPEKVSTGPYHVGATLFPGWTYHSWNAVWSRAPWRKPVLGWYDESKPETIDWQIKYLVENGVEWVMLCWYWYNGKPGPNAWPTTLQKARYKSQIKWCLQWGIWPEHRVTVDEVRKVAKYWCDTYFKAPEYFRLDGKPVVNIFTGSLLEKFFGADAKAMLEAIRDEVAKAGLPGVVISAQRNPGVEPSKFAALERLGFDRTTVYKYVSDGESVGLDGFHDYRDLADRSAAHWRTVARNSRLPFFPSLTTGYDARPWHGEILTASFVKNVNAADFRRICEAAKKFSDESGERYLLVGPLDEWGEGSIGWPNRELGFGMLNAIRDTFGVKTPRQRRRGWPANVMPQDVGRKAPEMPYAAK